jgi:YVTN family beta-propeller protein
MIISGKKPRLVCGLFLAAVTVGCGSQNIDNPVNRLVTGKHISLPEQSVEVGNYPINMIATADGQFAISTDLGAHEYLWAVRTNDGTAAGSLEFSNKIPRGKKLKNGEGNDEETVAGSPKSNGLYYGLAATKDGTIFAAQGAHDSIAVVQIDGDGQLSQKGEIKTQPHDFPAGLSVDGNGLLYVANNTSGGPNPLQSPGSLAIYDPAGADHAGKELGRCELPDLYHGTSAFPLAVCAMHDGTKAYIDSERNDAVYAISTADPTHPVVQATISTGARPVGMTLSADERLLFVANSQSDSVSIISTASDRVIATVLLRPEQARGIPGCSPVAVALSPGQQMLYVALADMNAVAVVDIADAEKPTLKGYIPTGWYPSGLVATPDGKHLLVTDARGSSPLNPNNNLPSTQPDDRRSYILNVIRGDVRSITIPQGDALDTSTKQVLTANMLPAPVRGGDKHTADMGLASGRIKHIIYIIKENRTYDQVLGDLPQGNGDASLTLFGRAITPNLHALAERFVLLDNTYCCGEVSGDGWNWSTQGMASPYVSRNVPYNYSGRGRKFDFEGINNGYPTGGIPADSDDKPATTNPVFSQGGEAVPDVAQGPDHLWDAAQRAGLKIRNYGFYCYTADAAAGVLGGPDNYPTVAGLRPGGHDLAGITDLDYRRFDLDYADSTATIDLFNKTHTDCLYSQQTFGNAKATCRFAEWKREFELMLRKDPTGNAVPQLTLLRLGDDHTAGMKKGKHSPKSMISDNDYAVGEVVDALSHSPIWTSTAVFIIEDDAQAGEDHVDAHRTTAYLISPWIKPNSVDHRFYNTDSFLKTMELLLGIGPMTQYEAIAAAIDDWDSSPSNADPFTAIVPSPDLVTDLNPQPQALSAADPVRKLVELSDRMDFTRADAAPTALLNEVVWKSVRGVHSEPPARREANSLPQTKKKDADGDDDGD